MSNYTRGRTFEYKVIHFMESNGFKTIRAAGSKGAVDIVAVKSGVLYLIQCKTSGRISPLESVALKQWSKDAGGIAILARMKKRKLVFNRLSKDLKFTIPVLFKS